jgi:Mg2+-importing ATPase
MNSTSQPVRPFWTLSSEDDLHQLGTNRNGLPRDEAQTRLLRFGANLLKLRRKTDSLTLLINQFRSSLVLILIIAAVLAFFLGDSLNAGIILVIVVASGLLGFWQERGSTNAIQRWMAIIQFKVSVIRGENPYEVPVEEIVLGDMILLSAGDVIPADCLILESKDLFVDEATLTGETLPAEHLRFRPPETEFEHGIKNFGYFLMNVTVILVMAVFTINVYFKRPL